VHHNTPEYIHFQTNIFWNPPQGNFALKISEVSPQQHPTFEAAHRERAAPSSVHTTLPSPVVSMMLLEYFSQVYMHDKTPCTVVINTTDTGVSKIPRGPSAH